VDDGKTIRRVDHRHEAAKEAGRRRRVAVGLPVCVHDDAAAAREAAGKTFAMYGALPNYRRMLDREGAAGPADVAIVGNEAEVERQIRAVASAGATDLVAPIYLRPGCAASLAGRAPPRRWWEGVAAVIESCEMSNPRLTGASG
jgi:alkanesulfonate monooxygenase SsuD/methylene tetrahydromethanopterin reductase-like flavin-dependent oxidoreductase (luciferase family)